MNTINISADATASRIGIGNQYENLATAVVFDCSKFAEDHGAGTAQVVHRRPTESIGYVCTNVSQEGNTVTWLVTGDDTSFTGKGLVQLRWYVDDVLRESVIFPTYILPSVTSSDDAPAEVKSALEQLMEYINDNTISIEDLDERIANYFYDHPLPMEGEADGLVAGSAKQLLSESYTLDQVPYLFRKSPDSDRAVEEIVGGMVGWNQLINPSKFVTSYGITASLNGEVISFSGTSTAGFTGALGRYALPTNHICLLLYRIIANPNNISFKCDFNNNITDKKTTSTSCIATVSSSDVNIGLAGYTSGTVFDGVQIKAIVSDLTACFGTTIADYIYSLEQSTAGAGVAKLKEWGFFTEDYYDYCEPTLKSVEGLVSKKTVGFNQWDEEWEVGIYNSNTGEKYANNNAIRTKNKIKVLPNTTYYAKAPSQIYKFYYDADENYISGGDSSSQNATFTTPSNAYYMNFYVASIYGTTYNHDICINLSDPTRNGQYEPYESHTYSLDSTLTLRGVPKLDSNNNLYFDGDIYPADGQGERRFTERAYQSGDESLADAITDGTTTVVKLSTPTTFTAQPYHNPQIVGDTEEWVTTGIVPVGHATKYYQNLRKKIENLPWNFSSLIAPTEVTNKATRNYTTGSYLILNNVLYKVTANIANGGTISPNSNCTATTIMAEFMSL